MATTPQKPRRRPGRPGKAEEPVMEVGCDPVRVLAAIASDAGAPAYARVSAARALIAARGEAKRGNGKARLSNKARAQRAAARAGGPRSGWGSDLEPNGHGPQ